MTSRIFEGFAGCGGWSEGLRLLLEELGLTDDFSVTGVEWDEAACLTARAAGHRRLQRDVRSFSPETWGVDVEPVEGVIMSPICKGFAQAGLKLGLEDAGRLIAHANLCAERGGRWQHVDTDGWKDPRSLLSLEPLRYVLQGRPTWTAWEQVPGVLPLWQACETPLRRAGYRTWSGILNSEQHGVPQARRRAVLMAHREHDVAPPAPSHSLLHRHLPAKMDAGVEPWLSMAAGLRAVWPDWQPTAAVPGDTSWVERRPAPTMVASYRPDVVAAPGYRRPGDGPRQTQPGSVLVTVAEAGVLQSFRPDYPWAGSESAQRRQIGDAVPPLLARAILKELIA